MLNRGEPAGSGIPGRSLRGALLRVAVLLGLLLASQPAGLAAPATVQWPGIDLSPVANGFTLPVDIAQAPGDSTRLYVVEQPGRIQIIQNGVLLSTPFLDISSSNPTADYRRVHCCGEQGLLSLAFPPGFPTAPHDHFYVFYTSSNPADCDGTQQSCDNLLERYGLTGDQNVANPDDHDLILTIPHKLHSNHNGGKLDFGPDDGYLYLSTGDGGGGGDPENNAQNLNVLLGKLLRIDVETGNPAPYTVPSTNPFFGPTAGLDEIWAYGLRNPWRYSFDRQTHDLYIGDVGQGTWEEIDFEAASSAGGINYGWDCREGAHPYSDPGHDCSGLGAHVDPVAEYDHTLGCAVVGGFVYRGADFDNMQGMYFYGDECSGRIWGLIRDGVTWTTQQLKDTSLTISTFGQDQDGNVYLADYATGTIYLIRGPVWYMPLVSN